MRVIQIETTTVPKASQAEVVLSDGECRITFNRLGYGDRYRYFDFSCSLNTFLPVERIGIICA